MIRGPVQVLVVVSTRCGQRVSGGKRLTLNLLVTLPVEPADLDVPLLEELQASGEGICDLELVVGFGLVVAPRLGVVERAFHLSDDGNDPLRLLDHVLLLGRDQTNLVVQRLGQGRKQLRGKCQDVVQKGWG